MATVEMIGLPADGAQLHSAELLNLHLATRFGCGLEQYTYSLTITGADMDISYPAFRAVVPNGSGSFVLVDVSASSVTVSAADNDDPRVDILVVDSNGTVSVTAGTPTTETATATAVSTVADVLAIVNEAPMPSLGSDEIMLAKIYVGAAVSTISSAVVFGRGICTDIYRWRQLQGWVADDAQNPDLDNEFGSNNLPAGVFVDIPIVDVTEAFNGSGSNDLSVGYDADADAFGDETDVSAVGPLNMIAGADEGYNGTARAVEAYFTNDGSEPSTGKALVILPYRFVPPIVS